MLALITTAFWVCCFWIQVWAGLISCPLLALYGWTLQELLQLRLQVSQLKIVRDGNEARLPELVAVIYGYAGTWHDTGEALQHRLEGAHSHLWQLHQEYWKPDSAG